MEKDCLKRADIEMEEDTQIEREAGTVWAAESEREPGTETEVISETGLDADTTLGEESGITPGPEPGTEADTELETALPAESEADAREIAKLLPAVEALLFAAGERIGGKEMAEVLDISEEYVAELVVRLFDKYNHNKDCGIMIRKIEDGFQMCSKPKYGAYISEYFALGHRQLLSQAAYETLAIIAYGQPATRAKVEKIRGVNSDSAVAKLLERGLICEKGRLEAPGRPVLYGTTDEFLRCFGYESLQDLPELHPEEIPSEVLYDIREEMLSEEIPAEEAGTVGPMSGEASEAG